LKIPNLLKIEQSVQELVYPVFFGGMGEFIRFGKFD